MRPVLDGLRDSTKRLIDENPVQVAVHRVARTDDGVGGWTPQESCPDPFTGRLVASSRFVRGLDEAAAAVISELALIAPYDADLRDGSDVEDTLIVGDRKYKVRRVIPRKWQGEVYSVHAMLEEVT